jgi:hypothetical protein
MKQITIKISNLKSQVPKKREKRRRKIQNRRHIGAFFFCFYLFGSCYLVLDAFFPVLGSFSRLLYVDRKLK